MFLLSLRGRRSKGKGKGIRAQASYSKVFLSFVNELQQNSDAFSKEEYILGIFTVNL